MQPKQLSRPAPQLTVLFAFFPHSLPPHHFPFPPAPPSSFFCALHLFPSHASPTHTENVPQGRGRPR